MEMSEGPKKQTLTSPLTEVHFTFDAARDSLPDQKAIIAETIHALEVNHGREIHIGDIEETREDGRVEHSVSFRSQVSNPGVPAPKGVFTAHDSFQTTEQRNSNPQDLNPPYTAPFDLQPQYIQDAAIGVFFATPGIAGLTASFFLETSWMSNSAFYLGTASSALGAMCLSIAALNYFLDNRR